MQENIDFSQMIFKNRDDAMEDLLSILPIEQMKEEGWILLALSRGAIEIVVKMAEKLALDFDIFVVKQIVAPNNSECQIAMISETKEIVMHDALVHSFGISEDYIYAEAQRRYQEDIIDYIYKYRKSLALSDLKDKSVLLVDEGCETGLSTICALKSILNLDIKKVSLATAVIAEDLFHHLDLKADKIFTNHRIENFIEVDYYYETLEKLSKKEIQELLEQSAYYLPYKKEKINES